MRSELINIQITTIAVTLFLLFLTWVEVRRLKSVITPFIVAAAPFIVIMFLVNFVLISFQFPPITVRSQMFIATCLFLVWLAGFITSKFFRKITPSKDRIYLMFAEEFHKFELILIALAWVIAFIIFKKMLSLLRQHGGFAYFGNQEYENQMIVGLAAHFVQLGKVVFIFLVFIYKKSKHKTLIFITLIFLGLSIASVQVKYHIMFVIIISFLFYNIGKSVKKQIKVLGISALTLFFIMNIFWISLTLAWGTFGFSQKGIWEFFLKQTLNYFVTGPIVLDTWLNFPSIKPAWTLLIVFINFFMVITGNPMRYSTIKLANMQFIQTAPGLYSNIGTAYGVYYIIGGTFFTFFITIGFAIVSYIVYFKSINRYNPFAIFFNTLFLTFGILTFFGEYFVFVSTYEISVIFLIFVLLFRLLNILSYNNKNINSI